jgi:hypothetical protein
MALLCIFRDHVTRWDIWSMCPPPPPHFYKNEKGSLFSALKFSIQRTKKVFLEWTPLFASKDSVKAISDIVFYMLTYIFSIFSKIFVWFVNNIKLFDFGHIQKCPFWPMSLHFRNAPPLSNIKMCMPYLNCAWEWWHSHICTF